MCSKYVYKKQVIPTSRGVLKELEYWDSIISFSILLGIFHPKESWPHYEIKTIFSTILYPHETLKGPSLFELALKKGNSGCLGGSRTRYSI